MPKTPQSSYATAEDWRNVRATVTRLYQDENRTLNEVMDIMERDLKFVATKKMYKNKIKDWGLDKKFKAEEVLCILIHLRLRAADQKQSEFYIRGRKIDLARLDRYLDRNPQLKARFERGEEPSEQAWEEVRVRTPEPIPMRPPMAIPVMSSTARAMAAAAASSSPSLTLAPLHYGLGLSRGEELDAAFEAVRNYADYCYDTGTWYSNDGLTYSLKGYEGQQLLSTVVHTFETTSYAMQHGEKIDLVSALGPAFECLEVVVREEAPDLTIRLARLCNQLQLTDGDGILDQLLDYGKQLTSSIFGEGHPLEAVWASFHRVVNTGQRDLAEALADVAAEALSPARREPSPEEVERELERIKQEQQEQDLSQYQLEQERERVKQEEQEEHLHQYQQASQWMQRYSEQQYSEQQEQEYPKAQLAQAYLREARDWVSGHHLSGFQQSVLLR